MKIALVTDTHLAARAAAFNDNWAHVKAWLAMQQPDRIIHLGDISADGASHREDLDFARRCFDALPAPIHFLPGNHDIGDNPPDAGLHSEQPLDLLRLADYRRLFGADRFSLHAEGWQLIGLNSQLLGTGTAEEAVQFDWLTQTLDAGEGPLGVFLHKPLFEAETGEPQPHERYSPPAARRRLMALLQGDRLRFIACGHAHQWRQLLRDGVLHVWAPSTSFCVPDLLQPCFGEKRVGALLLELGPDRFHFECVHVSGVAAHNLLHFDAVYPQLTALNARLAAEGKIR